MKNKLGKYTISELTGYQYRELSYDSTSSPIQFNFLSEVCRLLTLAMLSENGDTSFISDRTVYDEEMSQKITIFQETAGLTPNGTLNDDTLQALVLYVERHYNDEITGDEDNTQDNTQETETTSPHYNSFFSEDKYKSHRQNRKNIEIVFGQGSIKKTIIDVFMRSVSVEVDTSGNPISEVYEFIARDIKESDELSDYDKYLNGVGTSPSDIQHIEYDFSDYLGGKYK